MYSFNLVKTPTECASCGKLVTSRLAGHHYRDPMCSKCFRLAAPDLAEEVLKMQPRVSVQRLEARLHDSCANCGDSLIDDRIATFHFADPLCAACMGPYSQELVALLCLHEAALEAADGGRDGPGLLKVAISYSRILYRLDARRAQRFEPVPAGRKRR